MAVLSDENRGECPTFTQEPEERRRQEGLAMASLFSQLPNEPRFYMARILGHIAARAARRGGSVRLSYAQLARDLQMPEDAIKSAVPKMRKIPGLEIEGGPGRVTVWTLRAGGRA